MSLGLCFGPVIALPVSISYNSSPATPPGGRVHPLEGAVIGAVWLRGLKAAKLARKNPTATALEDKVPNPATSWFFFFFCKGVNVKMSAYNII